MRIQIRCLRINTLKIKDLRKLQVGIAVICLCSQETMRCTVMEHDIEMTPMHHKGEQPSQRRASCMRAKHYGRQSFKLPMIVQQYIHLVGK